MNTISEYLNKFGLGYEDLTKAEWETLKGMLRAVENQNLTIEKIKEAVYEMKIAVERELPDVKHNSKQDIMLKARLKNLLVLEGLFISPDIARRRIEEQLESLSKNLDV